MTVPETGVADSIGGQVIAAVIAQARRVIGRESLNSYRNVNLKRARLDRIGRGAASTFSPIDIADRRWRQLALERRRRECLR
ncbi:MAG: hypothetical protein KGM15_15810 [Pseudomonadota bacterium]|nr:hypothetical protein [Pseudomonadota bacterium]